jgi:hypothetical protein
MHENLELAIFPCADPEPFETELIGRFAPPLNLAKCAQSVEHRRISAARAIVLSQLEGVDTPVVTGRSIQARRSASRHCPSEVTRLFDQSATTPISTMRRPSLPISG